MARYKKMVLTDNGRILLAKVQSGECEFKIVRAATGDGEYDKEESLNHVIGLKREKQSVAVSSYQREEDKLLIRFIVSNFNPSGPGGMQEGYYVREVGIFADDPDVGEVLYAISVAEEPDFLPEYEEMSPATISFGMYVYIGNGEKITICADSTAYVAAKDITIITNAEIDELWDNQSDYEPITRQELDELFTNEQPPDDQTGSIPDDELEALFL